MKKVLLLLVFLSFYYSAFSQEYQSFLKNTGITLKSGNVSEEPILKVIQNENGFYTVTIESFNDSNKGTSFKMKPFSYVLFKSKFINSFPILKQKGLVPDVYDDALAANEIELLKLYSDIASYFYSINERPQVATVSLKNEEVEVYSSIRYEKSVGSKLKSYSTTRQVGKLINPVIEISFYAGFIEKIEVRGKIDGIDVTFVNKYSIGVSSISNIRGFRKMRLFSLYNYDVEVNTTQTVTAPTYTNGKDFNVKIEDKSGEIKSGYTPTHSTEKLFIYVNDIINYQRIIDVNANDISPDKQKIILDKNQQSSNLYKEESTKILEAIVYSDLLGALEEENPNGIIQTEIAKRFNINTARGNLFKGGGGFFEYLDGKILLSKIEENNKYLQPTNNVFDHLDLYQYRNFSAGGSFNLVSFENQNLKLNAFLETGLEFSRSGFRFSDEEEGQNANSLEWTTQVKAHFFPERRYGVQVSDKLSYYEILSDQSDLLSALNTKSNWINTIEFMAYLDISTSSKLFVRYSIVHDLEDINNNFSKFQLGSAFYILEKNRKDK
jgi:hypothetical protein